MKSFRILLPVLSAVFAAVVACPPDVSAESSDAADAADSAPISLAELRHAVACPPFTGLEPYAHICHEKAVEMLKGSSSIEFLEGAAATARNAPMFTYRLYGHVVAAPDGTPVITITLQDAARGEEVAAMTMPISTNAAALDVWISAVRTDMRRRVRKMPFECCAESHKGRSTLTLDRGLSAGLEPGMTFYISSVEEEILDHNTGEVIGRESPVTYGKVVVFRVNARSAYARPLPGVELPMRGPLYAHAF